VRILVTGTQGQVARSLYKLGQSLPQTQPEVEIICLGRPDIDLAAPSSLSGPIIAANPDVIISAAAYTAVDKAQSEPDLAQTINGLSPGELAKIAHELRVPIIHISTDYVYAGDKDSPYCEDDETGPLSVYGVTKLAGEQAVAAMTANHAIVRTSWVYSPYGANFVKTMLRLGATRDEISVVADQWGTPTYAPVMAEILLNMAHRLVIDPAPELRGVFHLTAQGEVNWAGFAEAIFAGQAKRGGRLVKVIPVTTADYPTPAKRPHNSRLRHDKLLRVYGLATKDWRASLEACLNTLIGDNS
jgi:dTDP-4-dehydrorhamnose reductase